MRIGVTGAAGFIGRAVVDRLARLPHDALRLIDLHDPSHPAATMALTGSYADPHTRASFIGDGLDLLFHLASVPGGAAEHDFHGGRAINLDASLLLFDAVPGARVVYASLIAALHPGTSYGTHKAMCELYLADLTRRGRVDGRSVRPAAIVARPVDAYSGFATAWMSDFFRAALEGRDVHCPLRATSRIWMQSIAVVADNIVHAGRMPAYGLPPHRAWTLPATVTPLGTLADTLDIRPVFGNGDFTQAALDSHEELALGFISDGNVSRLADNVLTQLRSEA